MKSSKQALALIALVLAGCGTSPNLENGLSFLQPQGAASIATAPMTQSRLVVQVKDLRAPAQRRVQNLTGLTYDYANLTLANATLLTASKTSGVSMSGSQKAQIYTGLRPGTGYGLDVVLRNGGSAGTRVGTGHADLTLAPGTNTAIVVISQDGQLSFTTSVSGNILGDNATGWLIVKGDTVTLNTGFAATETGVAHMDVGLSASLYGTATTVASITTTGGAGCDHYTWNTGLLATANGATFDPAQLVGTSTGTQHGTVTFTLYGATNNVIGRSTLSNVSVIDPASIDLQLQ